MEQAALRRPNWMEPGQTVCARIDCESDRAPHCSHCFVHEAEALAVYGFTMCAFDNCGQRATAGDRCKNHQGRASTNLRAYSLEEARLVLIEAKEDYLAGRAYFEAAQPLVEIEVAERGTRHDARHGGSPRPIGDHYFNDRGAYYIAGTILRDARALFARFNKVERARVAAERVALGLPAARVKLSIHVLIERDGPACHLCGEVVTDIEEMHVEHVVPYSQFGVDDYVNAAVAHDLCNLRKSSSYAGSRDHARLDAALAAFEAVNGRPFTGPIRYL